MYDLNHMGGGSSSGLFPLLSFTVTCIQIHQTYIKPMLSYASIILNNQTQTDGFVYTHSAVATSTKPCKSSTIAR